MASLQIRDLPDPLHRLLQQRASAHKRSLSQQALADLEAIAGGDPLQPAPAGAEADRPALAAATGAAVGGVAGIPDPQ